MGTLSPTGFASAFARRDEASQRQSARRGGTVTRHAANKMQVAGQHHYSANKHLSISNMPITALHPWRGRQILPEPNTAPSAWRPFDRGTKQRRDPLRVNGVSRSSPTDAYSANCFARRLEPVGGYHDRALEFGIVDTERRRLLHG